MLMLMFFESFFAVIRVFSCFLISLKSCLLLVFNKEQLKLLTDTLFTFIAEVNTIYNQ